MRNSLNNSVYFILILVHFMVGCRKDPHHIEPPNPVDSGCVESWCEDFPPSPELGWNYTSTGEQFLAPCFNPNNPDEFVYIKVLVGGQSQLIKYNLVTKQESILLDPMSYGPPNWGRQGWITFVYTDNHVWKIRDDGTDLTQLTFGVDDKNPMFNYSGDKIIYYRNKYYTNFELSNNPDLYKEYKMMIIDLSGQEVDSVMASNVNNSFAEYFTFQTWGIGVCDINDNSYFAAGAGQMQGLYVLQDDTILQVREWLQPQDFMDIDLNAGKLIYTKNRKGIFTIDIATGQEFQIRAGCDTRNYRHLSVSNNGKILVQKIISTVYDNNQAIDEQNEIWLIDLNSCSDERILWE